MDSLRWTSALTTPLGVLICFFAGITWPKSLIYAANPTANVIWLSIGSALISIGILALLLAFHADSVSAGVRASITADRKEAEAEAARAARAAERRAQ